MSDDSRILSYVGENVINETFNTYRWYYLFHFFKENMISHIFYKNKEKKRQPNRWYSLNLEPSLLTSQFVQEPPHIIGAEK